MTYGHCVKLVMIYGRIVSILLTLFKWDIK